MMGVPPSGHPLVAPNVHVDAAARAAAPPSARAPLLSEDEFDRVRADLRVMMVASLPQWPADYGTYAPLFVRQAWHCSGSYRTSDGRGGCDGGRQRFDPERSWEDNTNLDKARSLLWPLKQKYGPGLSWGDLMILAGNTAIESMGGPILGFCAGRVDDRDGSWSDDLGPTPEQAASAPCAVNGQCEFPLGSTTVGLIYLNPEGPMGRPVPRLSAGEVRDTFRRMAMNDSETVALIGGGHSFGKTHGACPKGAGPSPKEDEANPWPGLCGTGKGADAFTSGFEGPWTTNPVQFDNEYFNNLISLSWANATGPGGHAQWHVVGAGPGPTAFGPAPGSANQSVMMLTSDVSLLEDPSGEYQKLVAKYADDIAAFEDAFAHAWYKLTTRDMGPATRCSASGGAPVPPAQPWQYPLPAAVGAPPNYDDVAAAVRALTVTPDAAVLAPDVKDGAATSYGPLFVRLAWQCASTFRKTDYLGGCNGARIRFSPQREWPINAALDKALLLLQPAKDAYGDALSWADLIVIAANVAIEAAGGRPMVFCGGRTDASDGLGSEYLAPILSGNASDSAAMVSEAALRLGMTSTEWVALNGGGHSLGRMHSDRSGFASGAWTSDWTALNNGYFVELIAAQWTPVTESTSGYVSYGANSTRAPGTPLRMLQTDMLLKWNPEYLAIAEEFAADNGAFLDAFAAAWTKLVNADRFEGASGSVCAQPAAAPAINFTAFDGGMLAVGIVGVLALVAGVAAAAIAAFVVVRAARARGAADVGAGGARQVPALESTSLIGDSAAPRGNRPVAMSEQELPTTEYAALGSRDA